MPCARARTIFRSGRAGLPILVAFLAGCESAPLRPVAMAPSPAAANCPARLAAAGAQFHVPESLTPALPCVITAPVVAERLDLKLARPALMSCALAESLTRFMSDSVEPAARRLLGTAAVGVDHFGAYSCRTVKNRPNQLSAHAFGDAFDLAAVTLGDDSRVSVLADWSSDGPRGRFLHEIAQAACQYFTVVLTPDSNADHRDHLHLELGTYRFCRPS